AAAGSKVSIAGFAFGPQAITLKAGDSITWSNDDGSPHTVTFRDGSAGAQSLSPRPSVPRKFRKARTDGYFCSFHPYITGRGVGEGRGCGGHPRLSRGGRGGWPGQARP